MHGSKIKISTCQFDKKKKRDCQRHHKKRDREKLSGKNSISIARPAVVGSVPAIGLNTNTNYFLC